MAATRSNTPNLGNDSWSLFLRQKHLQDQLRRLRNDFRSCYCPPGCRGETLSHVTVNHALLFGQDLPTQHLHGPHVAPESPMPRTRARPESVRNPGTVAIAEARGTSDILLYGSRTRATLRMSLQVYMRAQEPGMRQYFGELFLTRSEQQEQFIGFILASQIDRTSDEYVSLLVGEYGETLGSSLLNMQSVFSSTWEVTEHIDVDRKGNIILRAPIRGSFPARWAMLEDSKDVLYINGIWFEQEVSTALARSVMLCILFPTLGL